MLVSVITPTYNTPQKILERTWESLKAQTYANWEWIIWDDSDQKRISFPKHPNVKVYYSLEHSGSIGEVKRNAFMVAKGDILVELDHDDELTANALQLIVDAMQDDIGFVYSDWCELLPSGESTRYPQGWAFGYGFDYWSDEHNCWVMSAPEINRTTMSHIVSVPNHVRAWRADIYRQLNGHNPQLVVADDYDLLVRTYLSTTMCHIPQMLYKQHISMNSAQREHNALIQEIVPMIHSMYSEALDRRFQ
jgi:glycosyltransferase involved in cell wall biosynthesis